MTIELSRVKGHLQDHLQEGLLIVVGTGLSIAEGIPGMGLLADHLKSGSSKNWPRRLIRLGLRSSPRWIAATILKLPWIRSHCNQLPSMRLSVRRQTLFPLRSKMSLSAS